MLNGYVLVGYVIGGIRITKPADANLLKRYVLQPFEWIRIAWIRTGGIRVEPIRIGRVRMGGIRLEWICVGYV